VASIASELVETGQTETGALSIVKLGMNDKKPPRGKEF